jgi:hypothetical protein
MSGGYQENADASHHLCELTENAQSIVQPAKDGTRLSVFVWMDFLESMVHVPLALQVLFTTPLPGIVKNCAEPINSLLTGLSVLAYKISTESTRFARSVPLEAVTIRQLENALLVVKMKPHPIRSVFASKIFSELTEHVANAQQEHHTTVILKLVCRFVKLMKYLTVRIVFVLLTSSESTEHVINAQQEHHTTVILKLVCRFVKSTNPSMEQFVFALRTSLESTEHVINAQPEHHTTVILKLVCRFVKLMKYLTVKVVLVPRTL